MDTGPLGRRRDVNPFVGLRHDGVERIVSSFKGLIDHSYSPTTGAYAGALLWGRYVTWSGDPTVDRALAESGSWLPPVDAVTAVLQSLELLEPHLSLSQFPTMWAKLPATRPSAYAAIATRLLLGDRRGTLDELARGDKEEGQEAVAAQQFRHFKERVLRDLDSREGLAP